MSTQSTIARLTAEKEEAFSSYTEKARELHRAYWLQLEERLPELQEKMAAKYPGSIVEIEETEWTNSDEFFFEHWLRVTFPTPLNHSDFEKYGEILELVKSLLPDLQHYSIDLG